MLRDDGAEWYADAIINFSSVSVALVACIVMTVLAIRRVRCLNACATRALMPLSLVLYGLGLVTMLTASTVYNLLVEHPERELLRRLDHAAIFAMIAGTYSPITLLGIRGTAGQRLFAIIWAVANVCVALKLLVPRSFEQLSLVAYAVLGWAVMLLWHPLQTAISRAGMWWLTAGCLFYTVGMAFYLWDGLPYQIAIWHSFVAVGAACHYACIVGYVCGPTALGITARAVPISR